MKQTLLVLGAMFMVGAVAGIATPALAQDDGCAGADTSIIKCDVSGDSAQDSGVWYLLVLVLNILTAGVGIAAVGGIVWGALKYASAKENADQVKEAKNIIKNVVIGILLYAGMYLFINFLVPGGLFT